MGPNNLKFGGGVAGSTLSPVVLLVVLIVSLLICFAQRRTALAAFLSAGLLIPVDQVMVIGGAHFPMLRIMAIAGAVRLVRERRPGLTWLFPGGRNGLDVAVILLSIFTTLNGILLFHQMAAFVYQAGTLISALGSYLLLRSLLRSDEEVFLTIRVLACVVAIAAVVMTIEVTTGHNPYAMLGGAHAAIYGNLAQRSERFRAQGPFGHSILAGTFGAVVIPLFFALWWGRPRHRLLAVVGMLSCGVMMLASDSSTPMAAGAAGVIAIALWPLRGSTKVVRWAFVGLLVVLQLVMGHPVWHLLTNIDISGGSSGFHRFMLVDQCIRHFSDWWLCGVQNTSVWGWDMWDTANQYVSVCENSGLVPFLLFITTLKLGFRYLARLRHSVEPNPRHSRFVWCFTCALFAQSVGFFGISYWDQSVMGGSALLVMISAMMSSQRRRPSRRVDSPRTKKLTPTPSRVQEPVCLVG